MSEKLEGTYCTLFFEFFLNDPALIDNIFDDGIHVIGILWSNRKQVLKEDKKMFKGEIDSHCFKNIICYKWYDNKPVIFLARNVNDMNVVSNLTRQTKSWATKTPVSCTNIIKLYKNEITMVNLDIKDKKIAAYRLNCKKNIAFAWEYFVISLISHL